MTPAPARKQHRFCNMFELPVKHGSTHHHTCRRESGSADENMPSSENKCSHDPTATKLCQTQFSQLAEDLKDYSHRKCSCMTSMHEILGFICAVADPQTILAVTDHILWVRILEHVDYKGRTWVVVSGTPYNGYSRTSPAQSAERREVNKMNQLYIHVPSQHAHLGAYLGSQCPSARSPPPQQAGMHLADAARRCTGRHHPPGAAGVECLGPHTKQRSQLQCSLVERGTCRLPEEPHL